MRTYHPMFDLETFCIVRDLVRDSKGGEAYLNIRPYLQRYALNTTLTLCYGIRMDSVWDDMLREVLEGKPKTTTHETKRSIVANLVMQLAVPSLF